MSRPWRSPFTATSAVMLSPVAQEQLWRQAEEVVTMGFASCAKATPCLAALKKMEQFPSLLPEEEFLMKSCYLPWPGGQRAQLEWSLQHD